MRNKEVRQKGFGIIEALITVFILSIGLVPLVSAGLSALDINSNIRDTYIAANLVQEGIEVARAIRDRNWLLDADPAPPNPLTAGMIGTWRVEWNSDALIPVGANPPLKIDSSGLYNYSTGNDTVFRRRIIIEDSDLANPDRDMRITSEVTWTTSRGVNRVIRAESHLFNWR